MRIKECVKVYRKAGWWEVSINNMIDFYYAHKVFLIYSSKNWCRQKGLHVEVFADHTAWRKTILVFLTGYSYRKMIPSLQLLTEVHLNIFIQLLFPNCSSKELSLTQSMPNTVQCAFLAACHSQGSYKL